MRNQLKNWGNCPVSEIAMNILTCCWLTTAVSLKINNDWTDTSMAATLCGGIALVAWLIWSTYILATKKAVTEMPVKSRKMIETFSWAFLIYCVIVNISDSLVWTGMIYISWLALAACIGYFITQKFELQKSWKARLS